jgi:hypothetical protein
MLSGFAIVLSVAAHCLFKELVTWKMIFDLPTALLVVASLLALILVGLLFEPLANYATKLLTTYPYTELGFKMWDSNIMSLSKKARQYIPNEIKENTYWYCKNWLHQNASDDSYMPFLAKYGFYRSMFLVFLLNAISIPFMYQLSFTKAITVSLFMFFLALVYLHRSGDFYRHMSSTVYLRFICGFENRKQKEEKNSPINGG